MNVTSIKRLCLYKYPVIQCHIYDSLLRKARRRITYNRFKSHINRYAWKKRPEEIIQDANSGNP